MVYYNFITSYFCNLDIISVGHDNILTNGIAEIWEHIGLQPGGG